MKRSLSLVIITLLFVVLGCNLDSFTGGGDEVPTPVADSNSTTTDASTPSDTTSTTDSDTGSGGAVSIESFNKIELGMSYKQVTDIMGSEGDQTSMSKVGSNESVSYQWKGEKFASIRARFTNDELVSKSQTSLTPASGDAELSQDKFNKVETGMSYDQVKEILGSDGEMTSISKYGNTTSTSYRWKGEKYSNIFANFRDDKLTNKTQSGLK